MKPQLTALVIASSLTSSWSCTTRAQDVQEPPARPVRVVAASASENRDQIRYSVGILPYEQVAVAFKAGGYVASVWQTRDAGGRVRALQPGDRVRAGAVLARVRDADYRVSLNRAESSVHEMDATLIKARLDLDRARKLFEAESLIRPDLDAAQAAFDAAVARVASGRAQVEMARLALADCDLVSPISGIVLERRIEAGSLASSGTVAFVLGRVDDVRAIFGVPDSQVGRIVPGHGVTVGTEAFPGSAFPGRITGIAPSADAQSRVFEVEITVPNADGRLRPGMIGTVEVQADARLQSPVNEASRTVVPLAAIVRSNHSPDGYGVFVVESVNRREIARARAVTLGAPSGNAVAVTRGVVAGERVIVMGANLITDGEPVRVIR